MKLTILTVALAVTVSAATALMTGQLLALDSRGAPEPPVQLELMVAFEIAEQPSPVWLVGWLRRPADITTVRTVTELPSIRTVHRGAMLVLRFYLQHVLGISRGED